MEDKSTCPPWWPQFLWELHSHTLPQSGSRSKSYPPIIEDIMASLHVHALAYLMRDQEAGSQVRTLAERRLSRAADNLSTCHKESADNASSVHPVARSASSVEALKSIDHATIRKMRELAAATGPYATGVRNAPFGDRPKPIDEAIVGKMRELAAATGPYPTGARNALYGGRSKPIDEAAINRMRELAAAAPPYQASVSKSTRRR